MHVGIVERAEHIGSLYMDGSELHKHTHTHTNRIRQGIVTVACIVV